MYQGFNSKEIFLPGNLFEKLVKNESQDQKWVLLGWICPRTPFHASHTERRGFWPQAHTAQAQAERRGLLATSMALD